MAAGGFGGAKSAHPSLALDMLAGAVSGAAIFAEVPNATLDPSAVANVGHLFLVIDAGRLMPPETLSGCLADARAMLRASAADTETGTDLARPRLPEDRALAQKAQARRGGVPVDPGLLARLEALAR